MSKALAVFISYFLGNILFARIIAVIKRVDFKGKGSGNPGATNTFRVMGPLFGLLTLLGDTVKGILGTYLGLFAGGPNTAVVCGFAVVLGHNWPILHGFQGGKGIATTLGVIIVLMPKTLWVLVSLWVIVFLLSRYVSLASLTAAVAFPLSYAWFYPDKWFTLYFVIGGSLLAIYRHRANIKRLLSKEEHRISLGTHQHNQNNNGKDQEEN